MTGTTDKPTEAPTPPPPASEKSTEPVPSRLFWPSPKTIRHVVIEVLIVAVGVLLALGIDQLRQHFTRLAQADEARQLLRAEMRRNLEAVELAMPMLAEAYRMIEAGPAGTTSIFGDGRIGSPLLFDAAYDLALQTGALYYLRPGERSAIAQAYRRQQTLRDNVDKYADALRHLASYPTGDIEDKSEAAARTRQARLVQVFATSSFRDQCRLMLGFAAALDEPRTDRDAGEYCRSIDPSMDVEAIIAGDMSSR